MTAIRFRRLAALALAASLAGTASAQTVNLRFATLTPDTFPYVDGMKKFKEVIEAKTPDVKVALYTAGALGAEREINEAILEGSVHLGIGAGAMANLAPVYNVVHIPFLIQGQRHMAAVADGPVGAELARRIEQQSGFRVLGWWSTGDSAIQTARAPVRKPDDLKGVKIRTMENPALVDGFRALGANPTPMALPEVYTSMKQGVIEGAHLDVVLLMSTKVNETVKYVTDWNQITFLSEPRPVIMKASFFDKLSAAQKEAIQAAMKEATAHERRIFLDRMTEIRARLVASGLTITQVDTKEFLERMKPVWDKYAKQLKAEDLVQGIIAARPAN